MGRAQYLFQHSYGACELSVDNNILIGRKWEIIVYSSQTLYSTAFQAAGRETQTGAVFHSNVVKKRDIAKSGHITYNPYPERIIAFYQMLILGDKNFVALKKRLFLSCLNFKTLHYEQS